MYKAHTTQRTGQNWRLNVSAAAAVPTVAAAAVVVVIDAIAVYGTSLGLGLCGFVNENGTAALKPVTLLPFCLHTRQACC